MINVGINGFGRIGRMAFRIALAKHSGDVEITAVNTSGSMSIDGWAYLVNYDSMYGKFGIPIDSEEVKTPDTLTDEDPLLGYFKSPGKGFKIPVLAQREPERIPWAKYKADVIIEATGKFTKEEDAKRHGKAGAKRVIISAPSKGGNVGTYVLGVNDTSKYPEIISSASCTTNCVAPIASVMHAKFGVKKATMTTIHGYTADQRLQDGSHKKPRRRRAAAINIIPTTTGAAVATTETIPALKGLFDGTALRVPVATGSITDFVFVTGKKVTVEQVNNVFVEASKNPLYKGILAITNEPLVSSDIVGRSESAIVDLGLTQVIDGDLVKVFAWYDNEWGYANRLVEQVIRVGNTLSSNSVPTDSITLSHR